MLPQSPRGSEQVQGMAAWDSGQLPGKGCSLQPKRNSSGEKVPGVPDLREEAGWCCGLTEAKRRSSGLRLPFDSFQSECDSGVSSPFILPVKGNAVISLSELPPLPVMQVNTWLGAVWHQNETGSARGRQTLVPDSLRWVLSSECQ